MVSSARPSIGCIIDLSFPEVNVGESNFLKGLHVSPLKNHWILYSLGCRVLVSNFIHLIASGLSNYVTFATISTYLFMVCCKISSNSNYPGVCFKRNGEARLERFLFRLILFLRLRGNLLLCPYLAHRGLHPYYRLQKLH